MVQKTKLLIRIFRQSEFAQNAFTLAIGTALAQAIPIVLSLALRRLYLPEDFGAFAVYLGLLSPLTVIATLRYELTVVLPKDDKTAANLVFLASLIALVFSVIIFVIVLLFRSLISAWINIPDNYSYLLYFLPLSLYFFATFQAINYWLIRKKAFRASSINKIARRGSEGIVQIIFGFFKKPFGLVFGDVIGNFFNNVIGLIQLSKTQFRFSDISSAGLKDAYKKYSHFPKYNTFPALLNALTLAMPVFFINKFFSTEIAGYYDLTNLALVAPFSLISVTISQVLLQRLVEKRNSSLAIRPELLKVLLFLSITAILAIFVIKLFGVELFSFFFGSKWVLSGEYAKLLILCFALRFVVSPLSITFVATEKIRIQAIWQVLNFLIIGSLLFVPKDNFLGFLRTFVVLDIISYSLYFILISWNVNNYEKKRNVIF